MVVATSCLTGDRRLVSIGYPGGLIATIDCSWFTPAHHPTWDGLTPRLVGENGIADMDAFGQAVHGFQESSRGPLRLDFGACWRRGDAGGVRLVDPGRARPQPDGEARLRSLHVVARAYESYASLMPA